MGYLLLHETKPKARKRYLCIWCPEFIEIGQQHIHEASVYDGDFQDHRWHPECKKAADEFFAQNPHEEQFEPHGCKRGTSEEAVAGD